MKTAAPQTGSTWSIDRTDRLRVGMAWPCGICKTPTRGMVWLRSRVAPDPETGVLARSRVLHLCAKDLDLPLGVLEARAETPEESAWPNGEPVDGTVPRPYWLAYELDELALAYRDLEALARELFASNGLTLQLRPAHYPRDRGESCLRCASPAAGHALVGRGKRPVARYALCTAHLTASGALGCHQNRTEPEGSDRHGPSNPARP